MQRRGRHEIDNAETTPWREKRGPFAAPCDRQRADHERQCEMSRLDVICRRNPVKDVLRIDMDAPSTIARDRQRPLPRDQRGKTRSVGRGRLLGDRGVEGR